MRVGWRRKSIVSTVLVLATTTQALPRMAAAQEPGAGVREPGAGVREPGAGVREPAAHAAGSVSVNDTGHLHLLKAFGSVLQEEGWSSGTLPGQTKARLVVGSSVSATFTIYTRYGAISGSGHAALHSSGRYSSFGGSLSVSGGSGRYAHARGGGKLYGTIDRRTHAVVVQAIGSLTY